MIDLTQLLIGAGGGSVITGAISIWVKEKARTAAREQFRELIRAELAIFKAELIAEINGTYVRSAGANISGAELERRLERLEGS